MKPRISYSIFLICFGFVFCFSSIQSQAQSQHHSQVIDCEKMHDSLYTLADEYYSINAKTSLFYSQELLQVAKLCNADEIYVAAYESLGWAYLALSDFPEAVNCGEKALDYATITRDSSSLMNCYNLLGNIYIELPDKDFALEYFNKGIEIAEQTGDENYLSSLYNNVAIVYEMFDEIDAALVFYIKAKTIFEKGDNPSDKALIYLNIGDSYFTIGRYDSATYYFEQSRKNLNTQSVDDADLLSMIYLLYASDFSRRGEHKISLAYLDSSYSFLGEANSPTDYIDFYYEKGKILFRNQDYKESYLSLERAYSLKDSIMSDEISNKLRQVQLSAHAKRKEEEIQKLKQENEIQNLTLAENKATQKSYLMGIIMVAIASCFLIFVLINHRRNNKKLKQRNSIIENQSIELNKKHIQLQEINKEIVDSINYAKRIQNAILPSTKLIKTFFPDSFVLYKPKDIVAGDFYWLEVASNKVNEKTQEVVLFAAADCTGHGVPGAMVSVICNNGLNRSVREHGITDPGKILDKTREIVIQEFEKSDDIVKDGMDISLCALSGKKLLWSGANNPLWIIRKDSEKIDTDLEKSSSIVHFEKEGFHFIEIKADKQPIGKYVEAKPFNTREINLCSGDSLFICTDGYQDQFGGERGKKFKASKLKSFLVSIQNESMQVQKELIDEAFENWRGSLEQIDDVCVIGLRI